MRLQPVVLLGILSAGTLIGCDVESADDASEGVTLPPPPQHGDGTPTFDDGVIAKAVRSVPAIDTSNRAAVVAAYNTYFNVAMPDVGFTGNAATCTPGSVSLAFQEWTISRINFLRAMAGVPGSTTLNTALDAQQQAAALMMAANQTLTHAPTSVMKCYTDAGRDGARSSNLSMGALDSIPAYMSDYGPGNYFVGHRRWVLHARKSAFSLGQAASASGSWYSALQTFQSGPEVSVPHGVPWPPRGYAPLALFPDAFSNEGPRWSFGLPGSSVSFAGANVTMTKNGAPLAITVKSRTDDGFGDRTIVWELPVGHAVAKDETYRVTITGVTGATSSTFSYEVLPFDPAADPADQRLVLLDAPWYLNKYPDLKTAFGTDVEKAKSHFLSFGIKEGRDASASFSIGAYLARYTDLQKAFGSNYEAALNHWFTYGKNENRNPSPAGTYMADGRAAALDPIFYANQYADLKQAFGYKVPLLVQHWLSYGIAEGRLPNASAKK